MSPLVLPSDDQRVDRGATEHRPAGIVVGAASRAGGNDRGDGRHDGLGDSRFGARRRRPSWRMLAAAVVLVVVVVVLAVVVIGGSAPTSTSAPRSVRAVGRDHSVQISWHPMGRKDAVTGYVVSVTPVPSGRSIVVHVTGHVHNARLRDLRNGMTYRVTVAPVTGGGTGPASAPVTVEPAGSPSEPRSLGVSVGSGTVSVHWSAPSDDGGSAVTGYRIQLTGRDLQRTENLPSGQTSYRADGLTNGAHYTVRLRAVNHHGTSSSAVVRAGPAGLPGAPTDVKAIGKQDMAHVKWARAATNGTAIRHYTVTLVPSGAAGKVVRATSAGSGHSLVVTGLKNGTSYDVTVGATNRSGTGPQSAAVQVVPSARPGPPGTPTLTVSGTTITARWAPVADTGGVAVDGYVFTVREGPKTVKTQHLAAGATSASAHGLTPGATYRVTVRATSSAGIGKASVAHLHLGTP